MSEASTSRNAASSHRFGPGQEDEARAFVEQPTAFETYKIVADRFALWMGFFSLPIGLAMYWLFSAERLPSDAEDAWIDVVFAAALTLGIGGLSCYRMIQHGWFVLDPERGEIRCAGDTFSFADVRDPKITTSEREFRGTEWQVVKGAVAGIEYRRGTVLLGDAGFSHRRLEHVVELLSAMAAEYQEKEAVRRWLAERKAAASTRAPPDSIEP